MHIDVHRCAHMHIDVQGMHVDVHICTYMYTSYT